MANKRLIWVLIVGLVIGMACLPLGIVLVMGCGESLSPLRERLLDEIS